MASRTLKVDIVGEHRRLQQTFDAIDRSTGKLAHGFQRFGGLATAAVAGIGAAAVVAGVKSTIDAASDLNETVSKTNVIFGKSSKEIRDWSQGSARSMGLSRQEALASAASFGDMFLQLKLGRPQAVDMSKSMVELAADFASFHNADITQVLEAQSAAFRGEYDSVQRFIPGITAARVEQVALNKTHKDSAKDLTAAEKAQAVYTIMLKDGARAAGDFGRTSEGAANQQRIFKAEVDNLKASFGQALLPAFSRGVKLINEELIPALRSFWATHGPKFREGLNSARDGAKQVWRWLSEQLWPTLREGIGLIEKRVVPGLNRMRTSWDDNSEAIEGLKTALGPLNKTVFPAMAFLIDRLANDEIPNFIQQVGWIARAWTATKKVVIDANRAVFNAIVGTNQRIIAAAATVAEALHLPMARGLRKAEQRMGEFRRDFNREMDALKDERVNVTARAGITWTAEATRFRMAAGRMAAGGPVRGPGTATSDSVPIWASHGEHMWSAREVDGAGGHGAMETMRTRARGMAQGGAIEPRLGFEGAVHRDQLDRMTVGLAKGLARAVGTGLTKAMAAEQVFTGGSGAGFGSGSWMRAIAELRREGVPYNIISTFRAGARTRASGSVSFHALNRAVDLTGPNMLRIWAALTDTNPTELIYSGASRYKSRRGWSPIGQLDPVTLADHWSHVHAAYGKGGRIPEDVFGVGARSGRTYGFHGGETVQPAGAATIVINVQMAGAIVMGSEREVANRLEPAARAALKAALRREGKQLAEQL